MKRWILLAAVAAVLPAQSPIPDATVVAKVDGKDLTAGDLRKMIASDPRILPVFKAKPDEAIRDYFMMGALAEKGEALKLAEETPAKEQLENLRMQYERARIGILANAVISRELNSFPVPEEQVQKYYEANSGRFEQATVKIIAIRFKPGAKPKGTSDKDLEQAAKDALAAAHSPERSEEDARKLADLLVRQARGGVDFAQLAAKNSDDEETKKAGGDFGVISATTSYVPADLRNAALALKPGEVSDPIKVAVAFYIVRCEKKSLQPLSEVHSAILIDIRQQHRDQVLQDLQKRYIPVIERPDVLVLIGNGK